MDNYPQEYQDPNLYENQQYEEQFPPPQQNNNAEISNTQLGRPNLQQPATLAPPQTNLSRKNDLKKRLYDFGISHAPMPSVQRPLQQQFIGTSSMGPSAPKQHKRPLSAKFNTKGVQKQSEFKKKYHDANNTLLYQIGGTGPAIDPISFQNSYLAAAAAGGNDHSFTMGIPPKRYLQPPTHDNQNKYMSHTGHKVMPALRPNIKTKFHRDPYTAKVIMSKPKPREVPPMQNRPHPIHKQPLNRSAVLPDNMHEETKGWNGGARVLDQQRIALAGGDQSLAQKRLENARNMYLMNKLRGKAYMSVDHGDQIGGHITGTSFFRGGDIRESKDAMSGKGVDTSSIQQHSQYQPTDSMQSPRQRQNTQGSQDPNAPQQWSQLDKFIELLLDNKHSDQSVFLYLNPNELADPYDLNVCSYRERFQKKFYTLSSKGLTLYQNDQPAQFIPLGDWLIQRDSFNHIKELNFFKKFKRWKFMKMWYKNVIRYKRMQAANQLEEKLFILNDVFRDHLLKHRTYCVEMEKLRFVDVNAHLDVQKIQNFAAIQQKKRTTVNERVQDFSEKCRDNVRDAISKVLNELRERVNRQNAEDQQQGQAAGKLPGMQSSKKGGQGGGNSVFDALGFPQDMKYGQRAQLRKQCSRFLRFAYLVDFLALDSLSGIYIGSIKDLISRLKFLDNSVDFNSIITQLLLKLQTDTSQAQNEGEEKQAAIANQFSKNKGQDPLFYVKVQFLPDRYIPDSEIILQVVDQFKLAPQGTSKVSDFSIECHAEILPDPQDEKNKQGQAGDQSPAKQGGGVEMFGITEYKKKVVPNLHQYWLEIKPSKAEFINLINNCFNEGLQSIQVFERWSKHDELTPYASALEEWDDMVGDDWEEPDSNYLNPKQWIAESPTFRKRRQDVDQVMTSTYNKAEQFLASFQGFLQMYWSNSLIDFYVLVHERLHNPCEILSHLIKLLQWQSQLFEDNIESELNQGLLRIDSSQVRQLLLPSPKRALKQIETIVPSTIRSRCDVARTWLQESLQQLGIKVEAVEEYVEQNKALERVSDGFQTVRDNVDLFGQYYNILQEFEINYPLDDRDTHNELVQLVVQLNQLISTVEQQQEMSLDKFRKVLDNLIPQLNTNIDSLADQTGQNKFLEPADNIFKMLKEIDRMEENFNELEKRSAKYNQYQEVLQTNLTVFDNLGELREQLTLRALMWRSTAEWDDLEEGWINQQFGGIDAGQIDKMCQKFAKITIRVTKNLPENPVAEALKDKVKTFQAIVPIVKALRNDALTDVHWGEIKTLLKQDFDLEDEEFTLQSLIDMNAMQYMEEIQQISIQASQERSLRQQLAAQEDVWKRIDFIIKPYKQKDWILGDVEEIYVSLDQCLANVNTILGNRYVKPLRAQAETFRLNMLKLQNIMDAWVKLQHQWIYLQNIFTAPDIRRNLVQESQKFDQVDRFFKNTMVKAKKNTNPIRFLRNNGNIDESMNQHNETLDQIQKQLEDYLETKRVAFPRFYFISNDELIQILAKSQNLEVIQQTLRKCFDNITRLDIEQNLDITGMNSSQGEKVPFVKSLKARGPVEGWLDSMQEMMIETLKRHMRTGFNDHSSDLNERKQWMLNTKGQIVSTISQVMWCSETEFYIESMKTNPSSLNDWYDQNKTALNQLTDMVGGELVELMRKVVVALITQDVHARDIVEKLMKEGVSDKTQFTWQQQLRYYWENEKQIVQVKQVNATLGYGYEYMGATSRLVITPLTDRCWITITGAINIKLGANPAGPAGTGKTESTKDLAKGLGTLCIVFNCSDQIDYKMIGRFFSGLAQQGAWSCLDEFNRIDIEVLSVIAQQLRTIRNALLNIDQTDIFTFQDRQIKIKMGYAVNITMNPGYAGRTELPDNLKVLFRPMAMMIPDYGLIAQIMLFAQGFRDAKNLSQKMVKLYKLSSEQLSQQDHYDFGMRAVKSVLVMAGALKRKEKHLTQNVVLIRAMRDSNVPKFLKDDLPLFSALVQDLFPGVQIPAVDYGELQRVIQQSIENNNLQKIPQFITKVIQLFDTFNVRFGVMIVGPTGGGKTTCFTVLSQSMTSLRQKYKSSNQQFQKVITQILNPKSISMGQLYGQVNKISQQWHDGLASKIMRQAANQDGQQRNWVVFDGPVDALWIENMNTVLDDNMTLCLANGQRIKLRPQMRMLFEVQDLSVASPATVSRCGMVYITPDDLGWKPYVLTWLKVKFPHEDVLTQSHKQYLIKLFDTAIDPAFELIKQKNLVQPIPTVPVQAVTSICNFLQILMVAEKGFVGNNQTKMKFINNLFAFSYTWGIGGSLQSAGKEKFDFVIRDIFNNISIPPQGTFFDYSYNMKSEEQHVHWSKKVPQFVYDKELPYFQLLVPTQQTVKHAYLLETLLEGRKPTFFTGVTGVGKSVIAQNLIVSLKDTKNLQSNFITFSAQTSSIRVQSSIEQKLEKRKRTVFGPRAGTKMAVFIDDVNMPAVEVYGAQPPIELLRLLVDKQGFYDRDLLFWKTIEDSTIICAAAPPGGGRNDITQRFTRHFNIISLPQANRTVLQKIFGSIMGGFLKTGFVDLVQKLSDEVVVSTVQVYFSIIQHLLPTPARFHYIFNLRDISKVIQGILMARPISIRDSDTFARLWIHEISRVFHDRLINDQDRDWFNNLLIDMLAKYFHINWDFQEIFKRNIIIFGDILKLQAPQKLYEQINDKTKLKKILQTQLQEYNSSSQSDRMSLVFFEDAILHIIRIARVLRQPRGNLMLIGVGGSGKQSLTKLSTSILEYTCQSVQITKRFGPNDFKQFIKGLMFSAGIDGNNVGFLFTDTQIVNQTFLEDVNNVLNTGEIPNLFEADEQKDIIDKVRPVVIKMKRVDAPDIITATFVERVRDNLHIVLGMSPVGESLSIRCRKFPSLVNCCTLDWFSRWPQEALLYVSREFLKEIDLPSEACRESLSQMCMVIHTSVEEKAEQFYQRLRRKIYITPKSYLDLISLYTKQLADKRNEHGKNRARLANGVRKLNETNDNIAIMQTKLTELKPVLQENNEKLKVALEQVKADTKIANEKERLVSQEAAVIDQEAAEAQAIADEAEFELKKAEPELKMAEEKLRHLDKASIAEIKVFSDPPETVKTVMQAVMLLLGEKTDWNSVRSVLSDAGGFLTKLQTYNVSKTSESVFARLRAQYLRRKEFDAKAVERVNQAAMNMCIWVLALNNFQKVNKKVQPMKARYKQVKTQLDKKLAELKKKKDQVQKVKDKVARLRAECDRMVAEKETLETEMVRCENRVTRANKLLVLLADEGVRWKQSVSVMSQEIEKLVGNVFLSAAAISYYGGFTGAYRAQLIQNWVDKAMQKEIPTSNDFSTVKTMGDPVLIREWQIEGLPNDQVSTENGILTVTGERWPLLIDPQQQGNKWIRNMERANDLVLTKMNNDQLLRQLGNATATGKPLMIQDIDQFLDPSLDTILGKQVYKTEGGLQKIRIGDALFDYDNNFKFYISTKLPNPHYLPEICIKVTLINFTVTFEGLQDQLLGDVVKQEKPEIEKKRDELIVKMDGYNKQLRNIETQILRLLAESSLEQILDDDNLIHVLQNAKGTSKTINERVAESVDIEKEINQTRNSYRSVAIRGSILYFVISDLNGIDPMYQYSLSYVKRLFNSAIEKSEKRDVLEQRLELLIINTTRLIFTNVSRGIFQAHKTIFSFLISTSINRYKGNIPTLVWSAFLRGAGVFNRARQPKNPLPKYLTQSQWDLAYFMQDAMPDTYPGFVDQIENDHKIWIPFIESQNPQEQKLPQNWQEKLNPIQKLLMLKVWRPEKIQSAVAKFVNDDMGQFFIEFPSVTMEEFYKDTDRKTPTIFILSTGADPTQYLMKFVQEKKMTERIAMISLGQGQGQKAKILINQAKKSGGWVMLQNCHLARTWMGTLQSECLKFVEEFSDIHPDFRLFLTSMPVPYFPVSVLQNGAKLTTEPPRGIRANIQKSYQEISEQEFNSCLKPESWRKLLFGLAFFHATMQERRKFGPLGFNILYEFNDSDLETSKTMLRMFLDEQQIVPWDAMTYVTGQINYGGRVTDDQDRRCLLAILKQFYTEKILNDKYKFSKSGIYFAPKHGELQSYKDYIEQLPLQDKPEIFGMHNNANITYQAQESDKILFTILSIQPRSSDAAGGKSPDEIVMELASDYEKRLPDNIDRANGKKDIFKINPMGLLESLSTVLIQEIQRFNKLLTVMRNSLYSIQRAIKGLVLMTFELDAMYTSIINGQVPANWEKVAYPSLKPLASWFRDLLQRVQFMNDWLTGGQPVSFWLSGFFFPQGFMTGALQTHARKHMIAIDHLSFAFKVFDVEKNKIKKAPEDGVYIYGLFLESGKWDHEQGILVDPEAGQMYTNMPVIHFNPTEDYVPEPSEYSCPIYKTSVRAGALSTTGQSTNFIVSVELPTNESSDYWTLRATAMLCQLND